MPASPGALRFNTDSNKLELYDGNQWTEIVASSPDSQTGGARGVFAGGTSTGFPAFTNTNVIDYITISTTGNAIDFGDAIEAGWSESSGGASSTTRGVYYPSSPTSTNRIEYITISSTGNAQDFGDLTYGPIRQNMMTSNSTRGVIAGGYGPTNTIEYITISSLGDSKDFGDLITSNYGPGMVVSSPTRSVFSITINSVNTSINTMEFITISTQGNAADFGDRTITGSRSGAGASNAIRGLFAGGSLTSTNTIDFITISTLGNAQDFGDLLSQLLGVRGTSSSTRGVFAGGETPGSPAWTITNTISYVQIMSTGNAVDFGDLTQTKSRGSSLSNGHGGL